MKNNFKSRILKFRALYIEDKTLLYWDFPDEMDLSLIDRDTITQFTGIKDKNGKDVYEGDIVEEKYFEQSKCWFCQKFIISYKYTGFGLQTLNKSHHRSFSDGKDFTVIGNIFENPELLKN